MNRCPDCQGELKQKKANVYQCTECGATWKRARGLIKPNKPLFMELFNDFDGRKRAALLRRLK